MGRSQKRKGKRWERDAVEALNKNFPDTWKRVAMSGAMGTQLDIPILKADIIGNYPFMPRQIVGECKVGYGGKQMTVKKEWFDKIGEIADETYATPLVLLKFEYARKGTKHVVAMDFDVWDDLMTEMAELREEVNRLSTALEEDE